MACFLNMYRHFSSMYAIALMELNFSLNFSTSVIFTRFSTFPKLPAQSISALF